MIKKKKSKSIKTENQVNNSQTNTLNLGKFSSCFRELQQGNSINLKDKSSAAGSHVYIKATEARVFQAEPDGALIPQIQGQKKCDYLIYSQNRPQLCFFELKGKNISSHKNDNPHLQILETIKHLKQEDELRPLFERQPEIHAFIASPISQQIPKDIGSYTKNLWKELKSKNNLHYVKVLKSVRYSDKKEYIQCSGDSPIHIPYQSADNCTSQD